MVKSPQSHLAQLGVFIISSRASSLQFPCPTAASSILPKRLPLSRQGKGRPSHAQASLPARPPFAAVEDAVEEARAKSRRLGPTAHLKSALLLPVAGSQSSASRQMASAQQPRHPWLLPRLQLTAIALYSVQRPRSCLPSPVSPPFSSYFLSSLLFLLTLSPSPLFLPPSSLPPPSLLPHPKSSHRFTRRRRGGGPQAGCWRR